jgi:adenosylcobinamide amidohydrolase
MVGTIGAAYRETLRATDEYRIQRLGRFLVAELVQPSSVLSTSFINGGQSTNVRFLVNHQSCEAAAHLERHTRAREIGLLSYHREACAEAGLDPDLVVLMGTAANMNYASVIEHSAPGLSVTAVVTAGVLGNAASAADPADWNEDPPGFEATLPYRGTINVMLLINRALTQGALAGAVTVMTEAKSAALQQLAVRSKHSSEFATGTSTDQYCIACTTGRSAPITSVGTGVRLGQMIGRAVKEATAEALRWQNGLEPSYARSIFHALGPYGPAEATFFEDIAPFLSDRQLELLRANRESVVYEPLVAAAAYAMATILDRLRHGILPASTAREALRYQAASMAASLAARPHCWPELFHCLGEVDLARPARLVLSALGLGWTKKWT